MSNGGRTENPELVSVTRDGDTVLFEFEQHLDEEDVVENNGGLRIYFPSIENDLLPDAGALAVDEVDRRTLRAFYGDDLPEGSTLGDAVGGLVTQGSIQAARVSEGPTTASMPSTSAFDERRELLRRRSTWACRTDTPGRPAPRGCPAAPPHGQRHQRGGQDQEGRHRAGRVARRLSTPRSPM